MRRAIIHIGTPRTGTSSLQMLLHIRRDDLHRTGILYPALTPASAADPHVSHQHLGETLDGRRPRRERGELIDRLDRALAESRDDVVLLSYESLCLLPPWHRAPRLLCGLFERRGFRPEILMTVRPQGAYLQSQYTWRIQFLREARAFATAFEAELRARRYDYWRGLKGWARAAAGRVHLVPVQDRQSPAPLIERIAVELGLADRLLPLLTPSDLAYRTNESLGPIGVEVSRRLRAEGAGGTQGLARAVTARIDALAHERGFDAEPFRALDPAMTARVAEAYDRQNDALARRVWGTDWSTRVAEPPPREVNELARLGPGSGQEVQVAEILGAIRSEFGTRFPVEASGLRGCIGGAASRLVHFARRIL
ncbi:hypothetical protein [Methylobacterium frigidaeris]|uniref:Sulfotransferase family protein n=1 Tax=Methylobacterium frigidaeris TaxID=2038277 RepID=A0AA37HAQ2_9HYPH|nr:hypothetical protein [Methylobacterium frigidaeris]PIK72629.1 hypothetical protein CS379_12905 [Methylobacterium frigidaeris]GJD61986.1 hypothetical protein MPEAHAMD_2135 [Methylobacterium frigidaeris]